MIGAHAPVTGDLGLPMATGRMSSGQMPVVKAIVDGQPVLCLVDTGSGCTMVSTRVVVGQAGLRAQSFLTADGSTAEGKRCRVVVRLHGHTFPVAAVVVDGIQNLGVDCLLGCDVVDHMGGVSVRRGPSTRYSVSWGKPQPTECCGDFSKRKSRPVACSALPLTIVDKDFEAKFADGKWTVSWRWVAGEPSRLQSRVSEYKCTQAPGVHERYVKEIQEWISKGWLVKWSGPVKGIIPLLAVVQPTKDKVRPVMDYRELNHFVQSHTGDEEIAICAEKVRRWRKLHGELRVVDLKSAYLQVRVSKDLWQYQVVRFQGVTYALTRLGFGLTSAPRIMTMILKQVLAQDENIARATDHYIDDIMVQESVVSASRVRKHLLKYGLESKEPEDLNGGRVLGIALKQDPNKHLLMSRGAEFPSFFLDSTDLTKRDLFSLCGRLIGHYPIVGWLRPHCSFLKRLGSDGSWDEPVKESVRRLAHELLHRAQAEDPVRGRWHVRSGGNVTVWTDASSLAMGVAIQVDGTIVEDASWLRKKSDSLHINVAELEAVGRGINLAILWGFVKFTVATDSRTVVSWLDNTVEGRDRVRTKSAAQMLIKRRLKVIKDVITEYKLDVKFQFVTSAENRADHLTRVAKRWLTHQESMDSETSGTVSAALRTGVTSTDAIWAAHLPHHLGVDRTFYLVKQIRSDLTRDQVKSEISGCEACQRIDPATRAENLVEQGNLAVERDWYRIAADVTHYNGVHYLSLVDCGPSRFAIWRRLPNETAASMVAHFRQLVIERGPFAELLLDNATAFRSATVEQFAAEWGITLRYRAAYAPSGNGIVERNHRTIKRIAARGGISPEMATFWYNVTPRSKVEETSVPSGTLFKYRWRVPYDINQSEVDEPGSGVFSVGEQVWVKPAVPSCTKQWAPGRITGVQSTHVVLVDGMPRHVRDVRKRRGQRPGAPATPEEADSDFEAYDCAESSRGACEATDHEQRPVNGEEAVTGAPEPVAQEPTEAAPRRSTRERQPPAWLADYVP